MPEGAQVLLVRDGIYEVVERIDSGPTAEGQDCLLGEQLEEALGIRGRSARPRA